jgi:MFS family permease
VSSVALALNGAVFLAMFFLTAIYLQQVRGDTALQAGVHFLPMGGAAIIAAVVAAQLVGKLGTRTVQLAGTGFSVAGLLLLAQAGASGNYAAQLLPGMVLFGLGIISVGVPAQIVAISEVRAHEAGAASGVLNTVYQVGGAIGLALVTTLSITRSTDALAHGASQQQALVDGFHRGLLVAAGFAIVNVIITLASPQLTPDAEQVEEASVAA